MKGLSDSDVERAVEAAGIDSPPASMVSSGESGRTGINEVDNTKTPVVFGRLWREVVSVFTLACAPGLNVCSRLWNGG